ncbi:MAG: response regulator, partial [Desulfamplus sp.]|nr:response regulator [Desulfamplus sp.]
QIEEVLARVETHLTLRRLRQELEEKNIRLENMNRELSNSLDEIKTLREIIPICCNCKKIRDDEGYWQQLEGYLKENSGIEFSHGICPKCSKELYPELFDDS